MINTSLLLTVAVVGVLLLVNEWWWHGRVHGEASRKSIHIIVGTFVATWPAWLSWEQIQLLGVALVVGVLISKQFNIFKSLHAVPRVTWGELYFGAAIVLTPLISTNAAIFASAMLHMSLADGLAAVVGHRYGKKLRYAILGAHKSFVGTLTFATVSYLVLVLFALQQQLAIELWLPLTVVAATLLENVAVKGLDNLALPLFITVILQLLG